MHKFPISFNFNINKIPLKFILIITVFLLFNFFISYSQGPISINNSYLYKSEVSYRSNKLNNDSIINDKISLKDAKEISYQAEDCIHSFQNLLNYISFSDNVSSELEEVIQNSCNPSNNKIFYNKDIIIEADIDPSANINNKKDNPILKYLKDFDLQYQKTDSATIKFSNIYISDVKRKDWIFVKAKFDANFASTYIPNKNTYVTRQREALIRVENIGTHKWHALIMSVGFYDPSQPIEGKEDNMLIASDTTSDSNLISQEDFNREKQNFILARQEEEKKQQKIFDDYVKEGNDLINNKQYNDALEMFQKAKDLKPLVPTLDKRIIDLHKLLSENTFDNYKLKGDNAKNQHNFKDAIQFYQLAISLKPEERNSLQPDITLLSKKLAVISLPNIKLQSGDMKGAISECEKILLDENYDKNEYAELYLIEGKAYQQLANGQSKDNHDLTKALENFNLAIDHFFDFKEARIQRANFLANYKNDLANAIADYDVLTTNELDNSPDKPVFFASKAKLKERLNIYNGAFADYNQALALNPKSDSIYFFKGQLEYKLKMFKAAEKSFSEAIKLNSKFSTAYFYRGLNFSKQNDYKSAGEDFFNAKTLGITKELKDSIDYLSNQFYLTGRDFFNQKKIIEADSSFSLSLIIDKCNSESINGKADILLAKGDELLRKNDKNGAFQMYNNSLLLYENALNCNPTFYDTNYKQGIAYLKLSKFDSAIKCFSSANKCDTNIIEARLERGKAYYKISKYKEAEDDLNNVIKILSDNLSVAKRDNEKSIIEDISTKLFDSYLICGISQYYLVEFGTAISSLSNALSLNKQSSEANYFNGLSYLAIDDYTRASKYLEQSITINPLSHYYYANGQAYFKQKEYQKAIENFSSIILADSLNLIPDKYFARGMAYLKNKLFKESLNDFDLYNKNEISKNDSLFFPNYGFAQLYNGQDSLAFNSFNVSLKLQNYNANTLYGLGCYYAKNNQFNKAIEMFEKAFIPNGLSKQDLKRDLKQFENDFLTDFKNDKISWKKYNELKLTYQMIN